MELAVARRDSRTGIPGKGLRAAVAGSLHGRRCAPFLDPKALAIADRSSGHCSCAGGRGMGGLWWLPFLFMGGGRGGGWGGGGGGFGGGGGGGFSGGGGSFGGGGSSGSW